MVPQAVMMDAGRDLERGQVFELCVTGYASAFRDSI